MLFIKNVYMVHFIKIKSTTHMYMWGIKRVNTREREKLMFFLLVLLFRLNK